MLQPFTEEKSEHSVLKSPDEYTALQDIPEPSNVKNSFTKTNLVPSVNKETRTRSLLEEITDLSIAEEIVEPSYAAGNTKSSPPPFISFATFNRLGITVRNLNRILESKEDFEMHIIDCNSKDNTWDYIKSLKDPRIKTKTRFKVNRGPIYVLNYNLMKRKKDQYFFTIDSDVYIKTENWLKKYMEVFEAFPEVGLLGVMRDKPYPRFMPPVIPKVRGDLTYLQLKNAEIDGIMDFVPGHLQALRPELIEVIGYWSEENGYGDAEISPRITHYTPFKAGFLTNVEIDMTQTIGCNECEARKFCKLNRSVNTCYSLSRKANVNERFARKAKWKYLETFKELAEGKRTAYCASILDPESRKGHLYHEDWALENFAYYLQNSN
ncbi:MAG TPA: glycosyltransferase family 2 protein [Peptococcaceae bacterium]|nr:glycosyltransferase family 2 protein [Peptococcaceae bacterium]